MVEMTSGSKYRVLLEFNELVTRIDGALKAGGLVSLPMGMKAPGHPVYINPQQVVALDENPS
jgi:hypothetical protein